MPPISNFSKCYLISILQWTKTFNTHTSLTSVKYKYSTFHTVHWNSDQNGMDISVEALVNRINKPREILIVDCAKHNSVTNLEPIYNDTSI